MGFGSYVAACAEVSVSQDGRLKIHRIVAATNPGHAVNPAQIERQVAGSFVYGLSAMMYGECTVNGGAIEQTNFDTYNVMRIDEMPKVEAIIMPSGDFWGGVGEPTIAVAAPAVLNAIFAATGKRIRTLPADEPRSAGRLSKGRARQDEATPSKLLIAAALSLAPTLRHGGSHAPPPGASSCSGCHAAHAGVEPPVPRLVGRDPAEIVAAMQAFAPATRPATVMDRIAKGFSDDEIAAIAAWYRRSMTDAKPHARGAIS